MGISPWFRTRSGTNEKTVSPLSASRYADTTPLFTRSPAYIIPVSCFSAICSAIPSGTPSPSSKFSGAEERQICPSPSIIPTAASSASSGLIPAISCRNPGSILKNSIPGLWAYSRLLTYLPIKRASSPVPNSVSSAQNHFVFEYSSPRYFSNPLSSISL